VVVVVAVMAVRVAVCLLWRRAGGGLGACAAQHERACCSGR